MKALPAFQFRSVAWIPAVLAMAAPHSIAAIITWDGGGANGLWSTGTNWDTNVEPTAADDVTFPVLLAGPITTTTTENALSLTFNDAYTLSGGTLALASGNSINVASGVTATISNALTITGGLSKTGDGTLVLGGSNTNAGGTTLSAGKIRAIHTGAMGGTGVVTTVENGATLEIGNIILDRPITLKSGATLAGSGAATSNGVVTLHATASSVTLATVAESDTLVLATAANELTGGGSGTVIGIGGPGAVRLSAASNFDGSWTIPSGRLELGAAAALGDQATSVTLAGGSLSGRINSATTFTGPAGSLLLTASSALVSDRTSASVGVTHTFGTLSMGALTLTVAPGTLATSGTAGITLGNVTFTGNPSLAINDSGATNGKLTTGSLLGGGVARTITKTGAGDLAVTGGATDLPAGSAFTATGGGTIEMLFPNLGATTPVAITAAQNPFGEATVSVTDGALRLLADGSGTSAVQTYQLPTTISLGGAVTLDPDRRSSSNTAKTFELPGMTLAADTVLSMSGNNTHGVRLTGALALQGDATLQGVTVANQDGLLTLNGGISGAAGDGLTIAGGTSLLNLTIAAASTYGGGTTMDGSNVTLSAANAFGTGATDLNGGSLTVNTDGALVGTVTIDGGTLRVNDPDALAANPVALGGGILDFRNNTAAMIVTGGLSVSGTSTLSVGNNGSGSSQAITFPLLNVSGSTTLTVTPLNSFVPNFQSLVLAGDLTLSQTGTTRIQSITEDAFPRTFIKTGTGTVEMEAAGIYSGGTEVLAGILLVEHADALGSGALTLGATSGTATATAQFNASLAIANDLVVRTGSSGTMTLDAPSGGVTWNGDVDLQKNVSLDNGSGSVVATFNGAVSGAGDVLKISAGEIVLGNASNSFGSGAAGSVTVNDGTLTVASDGALGNAANGVTLALTDGTLKIDGTFASSRTLTFSGTTSTGVNVNGSHIFTMNSALAGAGPMIKSGTGTMTLAPGLDSSGRGAATSGVTGGILRVQGVKNLSNAGPVTLNGSVGIIEFLRDADTDFAHPVTADGTGTLHVDRASGGVGTNGRHTLGALGMASGNLTVTGANGYGLSLGTATVSSSNTITNNAPGTLRLASFTGNPGASNVIQTFGGSGDIEITGALSEGVGTGSYGITKTGAGTLRFGASVAEFARITTVLDGTLDLNGLTYPVTDLTLGGAASALGAQIVTGPAGSLELADVLTFSSSTSPPGATITGNLGLGAVPHTFTINDSAAAAVDMTIDGPIGGSAGASIAKTGNGTLRFGGAGSTQPGLVSISAGALELAKTSGDAIGAGGLSVTGGTVRSLASEQIQNGAAVSLSGANDVILELNSFTETAGPLTLTQTDGVDYSGIRTGAAGTLVLSGDLSLNNNSGNVFTDGREVLITGSGSDTTPTTDGTLDLGGVTRTIHVATTTVGTYEPNANATIETQIVNGAIIKTGPRTLLLSHPNNTFAGGLQIAEGAVKPAASASLGAGPVSFTNTGAASAGLDFGTLTGTLAGDYTIGGSGSGSVTLTYSGLAPSTLVLSGNFDLQRDLTVDVVDGNTNPGGSAILELSGLLDDGVATSGIVKKGNGMLKLAAGNSFSGSTTLQKGILSIPADSALGDTTAALTIDGGCLQTAASFAMSRNVIFGTAGGSVRVETAAVLELAGDVAWDSGLTAFYGSGTTVLSGTTSGSGGDLQIGKPTAFAVVPSSSNVGFDAVLSLRGTAVLPAGNLLLTNRGVLELGNGDFTRALGTAAGEVQLPTAGGGGWAAHGADRDVNLGGAGDPVVWGTLSPPFLAFNNGSFTSYGDLVLGSPTGTHTVDFQNPIALNNGAGSYSRDLIVNDGPAALDARISGGISQTADPLTSTTSLDLEGAGTLEISGPMSGEIHLEKFGAGTVILSGTNTRSGEVYVYEGTLAFAADASWNVPEDIYVDELGELDLSALTSPVGVLIDDYFGVYGTLLGDVATPSYFEGYGTVDGNLHSQAGGYVFPDYDGLLDVTGDFTLDATAFIDFFIYGLVPQADYNQMRVGGAVNLSGGLYLGNSGSVTLAVNDSFVFLLNDGSDPISGTFDGLPEGSTVSLGNGLAAQITYQANGDGGLTGNDFGITIVPDSADLALTASAPLLVDLGAEIVVSHVIDNPGPATISDGVLDVTLPANAAFVSSNPAGTVNAGVLSISLPVIAAPGTTNVEVHFTAPASAAAVAVSATVSSGATDPNAGNNTATTTTAVLPGGRVEVTSFVTNPGGADATLRLDSLSGVHYSYQTSPDLLDWSDKSYFTGDGLPHIVITPIDKPEEFFRFAIEP